MLLKASVVDHLFSAFSFSGHQKTTSKSSAGSTRPWKIHVNDEFLSMMIEVLHIRSSVSAGCNIRVQLVTSPFHTMEHPTKALITLVSCSGGKCTVQRVQIRMRSKTCNGRPKRRTRKNPKVMQIHVYQPTYEIWGLKLQNWQNAMKGVQAPLAGSEKSKKPDFLDFHWFFFSNRFIYYEITRVRGVRVRVLGSD